MKKYFFLLLALFVVITGCNFSGGGNHKKSEPQYDALGLEVDKLAYQNPVPSEIESNYDCMDDGTGVSVGIEILNDIKSQTIEGFGVEVTDADESDFGDDYYRQFKNSGEYVFIESGPQLAALKGIMNDLLSKRKDPTGIRYQMHLLDDDMVNAFTAGGHIYMTTGIIDYMETESELAFVIGHEIGHNEKGHIRQMLKQLAISQEIFGDLGQLVVGIEKFIAPSFNQQNEIQVDFYGADLSYACGYNPCRGIKIWQRMAEGEGEYNMFDNFLRSHPYSQVRYDCLVGHIKRNYQITCKD